MATGTYAPDPFEQYCDDDGNPLSSGTLTTYAAGTSTPATTYSDVTLLTANTNPISLDAAGRPTSGAIFLTPGTSYKFVLKDVLGATVATRDNIAAVPLNPNVTGTWIPVIGGQTSTSGQSYAVQDGDYVKLGTLVIALYRVTLSAKGTMVGSIVISGLPFINTNRYAINAIGTWTNLSNPFVYMSLDLTPSVQFATILGASAATTNQTVSLTAADISDTTQFAGTLIYNTTS